MYLNELSFFIMSFCILYLYECIEVSLTSYFTFYKTIIKLRDNSHDQVKTPKMK